MRGMLAVAAREVRERRMLLLAAPAFGLLPVVVPRIPTVSRLLRGEDRSEVVTILLALTAVNLALALAVGLGASVLGRDIGERRISFYFSRPLPGIQIWAGKLAAALAMVAFSVVLVPVPALLLGDRASVLRLLAEGEAKPERLLGPLALVFVTALAAATAGALRARSGLLAADIAAFASVATVMVWAGRSLAAEGAMPDLSLPHLSGSLFALTLILLAATAAQVVIGRSDARRGHLALSAVIWIGLGLCAAVFFSYAQWILGTQPQDLRWAGVLGPPRGTSFVVRGASTRGAGYYASFLMDASGQRSDALGGRASWLVWSPDGSRLFWIDDYREELVTTWLGKGERGLTSARLGPQHRGLWLWGTSADGRRLLATTADFVLLLDAQSGAEIGRVALSGAKRGALIAPDRARLVKARDPNGYAESFSLVDVDFTKGEAVETGRIETAKTVWFGRIRATPTLDRFAVGYDFMPGPQPGVTLHAADGRHLATIPVDRSSDFLLMSDGRVLVADRPAAGARLRSFSADGTLLQTAAIPLREVFGARGGVRLGHEAAPGLVSVSFATGVGNRAELETAFVDTATGEVRRREVGIQIALVWGGGQFNLAPEPGSIGTHLFRTVDDDIVWFDPASGERRVLVDVVGKERASAR
jgi:hypothetical protein